MPITLQDGQGHAPKTLENTIVEDFRQEQRARTGVLATDVFPLVELGDREVTFFRRDGGRMGMPAASLGSESPLGYLEDLTEDTVTVETFKEKISPEKGADTALNTEQEILDLFQYTADVLRRDLMITRELVTWRGTPNIDGLIGEEGNSAHSSIDSTHVISPSTQYDSTGSATPQNDFHEAQYEITTDGRIDGVGDITAYVPPSVMRDLKQNDDLEGRFSGVETQGLTEDQVANILPIDRVEEVRTQVVRTNANGEPIDGSDNVVDDPGNAVKDNILEPYDVSHGGKRRNVVVATPGENVAFIPWYLESLLEKASNAPQRSETSVNRNMGFFTQMWTEDDPLVSVFKIAQEIGFHVREADNFVVLQDV